MLKTSSIRHVLHARRSLELFGLLLGLAFSSPAFAQDWRADLGRQANRPAPAEPVELGQPRPPGQPGDPNEPSQDDLGQPFASSEAVMRVRRSKLRHQLTFGATIGGLWGGAYTTERDVTGHDALQVIYDDGHQEPVDFTLWTGGLFLAYDYGSAALRLQFTLLARFDSQSYSVGGNDYQQLSGAAALSQRYGLLIGPAGTLAEGANGTLDAGFGVGPVLGDYQPFAALADSLGTLIGDRNVRLPASHQLAGVGGRAWLSGMFWGGARKFGLGIGLYCDVDWLHAQLPDPWPKTWVDHSIGVMLPIASRF